MRQHVFTNRIELKKFTSKSVFCLSLSFSGFVLRPLVLQIHFTGFCLGSQVSDLMFLLLQLIVCNIWSSGVRLLFGYGFQIRHVGVVS